MKRWLPFIGLVCIALFSAIYMVLNEGDSLYIPTTNKPEVIYRQACASCHGNRGEGGRLFYPALAKEDMIEKEVRQIIQNGSMIMPAFHNIQGDTLNNLAEYVVEKLFIDNE